MGREYDYIRGNTVMNPRRDYGTVEKRKSEGNSKGKKTKDRKIHELKQKRRAGIFQMVMLMAVLGLITIWRYSTIYKMQDNLTKIREDIKVSTDLGESLRVDLLKYASLDMIKSKAEDKLGMINPDKGTTVTVDMTKKYFKELTENKDTQSTSKSIFSKLKDALIN